jgi:hypothetical protein
MRILGSNFLLNGESLGIIIEKPFEILIKNKDLIRDEKNGVEPCENTDNSTKNGDELSSNTIWWARRENYIQFS